MTVALEIFERSGWEFLSRWAHVLSGIAWIGLLYYFNFVQVPSFAQIYMDAGAELPLPTLALISVSRFVKGHIFVVLMVFAIAVVALRSAHKKGFGRIYLDSIKLKIPEIGDIYRGYSIAKFSRTLGMVLKSGISLVQGLEMSKGVLNNSVLEGKLTRVIGKTKEGESVTEAMSRENLLPDISLRMFSVGEKSASLPVVLDEIADFHEQEVSHRVGIVTDLLEPALMIIMGLVIGTIVVLMYLPIFQLGSRL